MSSSASAISQGSLKRFRSPKTVIIRFVARRTILSTAFLALVFGGIVASKATGYTVLYPTAEARVKLAGSFSNNLGFNALFGAPHHLDTVAGYTAWNAMAVPVIIGAIWAFLAVTKILRGEESAGRWEMFLAGHTTARRATADALIGFGACLALLFALMGAVFVAVGQVHDVNFGVGAALFFALTTISSAVIFMAVGALASQLMPTRSRAISLAVGIFGVCFLVRSMGDTTSAHWLLNITPLGWIEKLQPLYGSQPIWLLPIVGLTFVLVAAAIWLPGRRDLGVSIFADKDTARPRFALLRKPLAFAFRQTRSTSLSWVATIGLVALLFGFLTKAAVEIFQNSTSLQHGIDKTVHSTQSIGANTYLGMVFFLIMPMLMAYVASAVGRMREDEAEGYIDNFLVRSVSRLDWLWGRISLILAVVILAGSLSGLAAWAGAAVQHSGTDFGTIMRAGINIIAPAIFTLGVGIAALGLVPRLTTVIAYGVIAWSFLIEVVSSGLNLNHWILDTSILHHVPLAPAVSPNWWSALALAGLGTLLCVIGSMVFDKRDLQSE